MTERALKLALEALELHCQQYPHMVKGYCLDAITAAKEVLAQPEQEPVAWETSGKLTALREVQAFVNQQVRDAEHNLCLIAANPQPKREWVGLTDEDWDDIFGSSLTIGEAIKVTEAKLKEKNT